jgi:hypothetical protein
MGRKQFDGKDYAEVIRKLETAWSLGCMDTEAALLADISSAALCEFLKAHPEIAERKERLKENPVLKARATLYKAIEKGDGKLALQYLERKRKKEFSTRQEMTGPDGAPLTQAVARIYIPHNGRNVLPAEPKPPKPQPKPTTKKPKAA